MAVDYLGRKILNDDEGKAVKALEGQAKQYENDWTKAKANGDTAGMQAAHEGKVKVMGDMDFLKGTKSTYDPNKGTWSTENAYKEPVNSGYTPINQGAIDDLMADIQGSKFSYNPENDPSFKAYRDMYTREGERAEKSTLADVAQAQGGVSSYAASAAQQANNYYAQQIADKVPYLEQLAYEKYGADLNNKYQMLDFLKGQEDSDYNRYIQGAQMDYQRERDTVEDGQWREQFDYGKERDTIADGQWREQFDYGKERDTIADRQWREQFDYGKERDTIADRQWREQFDYGKERDTIADGQWREQFDYGKERDTIADGQWREQFDYGKERDTIADGQWREQFDYGKERDTIADRQWREQFDYSKERDNVSDRQWKDSISREDRNFIAQADSQYWDIIGNGGTPSAYMLNYLGKSYADVEADRAKWKNNFAWSQQDFSKPSSGKSSGGGGTVSKVETKPKTKPETKPKTEKTPITTDSKFDSFVNGLNQTVSKKYGSGFTAIDKKDGKYNISSDVGVEYVVNAVMSNDDFSDEEVEDILFNQFGLSDERVRGIIGDSHYNAR